MEAEMVTHQWYRCMNLLHQGDQASLKRCKGIPLEHVIATISAGTQHTDRYSVIRLGSSTLKLRPPGEGEGREKRYES